MAVIKSGLVLLFLMVAEVTPWTIDLAEVRAHLFKKYAQETYDNEFVVDDGKKFYSNIVSNSARDEIPVIHEKKDVNINFDPQSYMEKKVYSTVLSGSKYLEGLRRSIQRYIRNLEGCNASMPLNMTFPPNIPNMAANFTMFSPPNFDFNISEPNMTNANFSNLSNMLGFNFTSTMCEEISRKSEHVRRLAELASWTTMRLQDLAYASKYQKTDIYEENELILKLAWFLDRIAYLTGYEPDAKANLPTSTQRPTTTSPSPMTMVPAPEPIMTQLMDCLKQNSSEPATVRCRYPLDIPAMVRQAMNFGESTTQQPSTDSSNFVPISDSTPQDSELLIASPSSASTPSIFRTRRSIEEILRDPTPGALIHRIANRGEQIVQSLHRLSSTIANTPIVRIVNRIVERRKLMEAEYPLSRQRRSMDNPLSKLVNYYYKYKVWDGSNAKNDPNLQFDIENQLNLNHKSKRSLEHKKILQPLRRLKHIIKNRPKAHYNTYVIQKPKIISHLQTIKHEINYNKIGKVEFKKKNKRSIRYEDMYLPRLSVDPQMDISYYVKNKEGTNYNPSLIQAAQVRLGLEQIFQTGNIEVVHRYGSNYNPLDPAPFYTGLIRTVADS